MSLVVSRSTVTLTDIGETATGAGTIAAMAHSTIARNFNHDVGQRFSAIVRSHGNHVLSGDGPSNVVGTITPVGLN